MACGQPNEESACCLQIPLASIVGVLRYDRLGGMSGCGTLESAASPGMTSSVWEFARGQPALQIDTDGFRSPVFVLIPDDNIFRKQSTASSMFEDASAGMFVCTCTCVYMCVRVHAHVCL